MSDQNLRPRNVISAMASEDVNLETSPCVRGPVRGPFGAADASEVWRSHVPAASAVHVYKEKLNAQATEGNANKMGTVLGVIFPCLSNILGVLLFNRLPLIVGKAGIWHAFFVVLISCVTTFITALSLSAIATNGKILAGGSYYLISRSLGPSLGTGVGLCFYCANSIGAAMYIIGFGEALRDYAGNLEFTPLEDFLKGTDGNFYGMGFRCMSWLVLLFCFSVCFVSVKFVAKLGTVFLMIVLTVILSMYVGLFAGVDQNIPYKINAGKTEDYFWTGLNATAFTENLGSNYDTPQLATIQKEGDADGSWGFFICLSIWFPAVTGIMAGSNRSADLTDPSRSISFGTLFAQIFTSIIYLSFVFLFGGVSETLLLNSLFIAAYTAWPAKHIVFVGVMASTVGAALASLTSASRLLDAISRDGMLPLLHYFSSKQGKEPRLALLSSALICAGAIAFETIDFVAPLLTMFFLMCYFCVNLSCAMLDLLNDPNWRPTFRYHHVSISLIGMVLCVFLMMAVTFSGDSINIVKGVAALAICASIFAYVMTHSREINWGDGFQGLKFQVAKLLLRDYQSGPLGKNWRPQILVLSEISAEEKEFSLHDEELIHTVSQLKSGKGFTIHGVVMHTPNVGKSSFLSEVSYRKIHDRNRYVEEKLKELGGTGFAKCVHAADTCEGVMSLIQTAGLGAFQPNCVLIAFPSNWESSRSAPRQFIQKLHSCSIFDKAFFVVKDISNFPLNNKRLTGFIDVWWLLAGDGGVMLLLAHLYKRHPVWRGCRIRLFALIDLHNDDSEQVKKGLTEYIADHRLQVTVHMVPLDLDSVFNANPERLLANARASVVPPEEDVFQTLERVVSSRFQPSLEISMSVELDRLAHLKRRNSDTTPNTGMTLGRFAKNFAMDKAYLNSSTPCSPESLAAAKCINAAIQERSADAQLVITTLPFVNENESPVGYMQYVDKLTQDIPRNLLVRGTTSEVITAFT